MISVPINLNVDSTSSTEIHLSWTAVTGPNPISYLLSIVDGSTEVGPSTPILGTSYTFNNNINTEALYSFRIRAKDTVTAEVSDFSPTVVGSAISTATPAFSPDPISATDKFTSSSIFKYDTDTGRFTMSDFIGVGQKPLHTPMSESELVDFDLPTNPHDGQQVSNDDLRIEYHNDANRTIGWYLVSKSAIPTPADPPGGLVAGTSYYRTYKMRVTKGKWTYTNTYINFKIEYEKPSKTKRKIKSVYCYRVGPDLNLGTIYLNKDEKYNLIFHHLIHVVTWADSTYAQYFSNLNANFDSDDSIYFACTNTDYQIGRSGDIQDSRAWYMLR